MTPTLCPLCLAANRIATANGPTCEHQPASGADWFPDGWATMGETARLAWLNARPVNQLD